MSVEAKFKESECVSDVIDTAPTTEAKVSYNGGIQTWVAEVTLGNVLTPTMVQNQPTVTWNREENSFYTLLLTDPDAPSRSDPSWGEWRHWLVVNIPGCDVSKGKVFSEYIGAGPPEGTGLHRYIFLIFKQPNGVINCDEPYQPLKTDGRNNTSTRALVSKYNLGVPVAGNFFMAEWDDYVPKLYAKLSSN